LSNIVMMFLGLQKLGFTVSTDYFNFRKLNFKPQRLKIPIAHFHPHQYELV
jgi:hypothetical protein